MEYDCQKCGACCLTFDVLLDGADTDRFERRGDLVRLTVLYRMGTNPPVRFMERDEASGRCRALDGELGECGCTIYADRPQLCREFEAGSPDCLAARRRHGLPVEG